MNKPTVTVLLEMDHGSMLLCGVQEADAYHLITDLSTKLRRKRDHVRITVADDDRFWPASAVRTGTL